VSTEAKTVPQNPGLTFKSPMNSSNREQGGVGGESKLQRSGATSFRAPINSKSVAYTSPTTKTKKFTNDKFNRSGMSTIRRRAFTSSKQRRESSTEISVTGSHPYRTMNPANNEAKDERNASGWGGVESWRSATSSFLDPPIYRIDSGHFANTFVWLE
jgi:hypothetical protein